jgi:hypothetical protein
MGDSPRHPNFVAKAFQQSFVTRSLVGKKLQRYRLPERQIIRTINLTHTAFAQQCNDAVA